jgi:hypothetical protein
MDKLVSFYEYLKIFESTQSSVSPSELSSIIDEIAKGWDKILRDSDPSNLPDFLKERPKDTEKGKKIIESGEINTEPKGIVPKIANAVIFWQKDRGRNQKIEEKFLESLAKKVGENLEKTNYNSIEEFRSDIEKAMRKTGVNYLSNMPYISLIKSNEEGVSASGEPKNTVPDTPKYISLSQEDETIKFFKDNQYDATKDDNLQEEDASKVKSMIDDLVEALKGGAELRRLVIKTSASRFRNTGDVENLSWSGLSYLRASSLALYIINYLKDKGFTEEQISGINAIMSLDPQGENGDGTSGPNPVGVRFGYYDDANNFIDGKDREEVKVQNVNWGAASINVEKIGGIVDQTTPGLPEISNEGKSIKIPVLGTKEEYEKFKYINIIAEVVANEADASQGEAVVPLSASTNPELQGLALKVNIPSKFMKLGDKGGSKSKLFRMFKPVKIGSSPKISIGKTLKCPKF